MRSPSARTFELVRCVAFVGVLCSVCIVTAAPQAEEQGAAGIPATMDDEAETKEGMVVDIPVLRNDGEALRVVSVTQGENGSVLVNGDDTLRYQPNEGFAGLDGFAYTVVDGQGHRAAATVSVRVEDIAHAPAAENQKLRTDEDVALLITLLGSDADDDPLSFQIQRPPLKGSLSGTSPNLSYTPDADYNGSDSFVFVAHDGHGGSDTGTVSIRIHAVSDVPVAVDDGAETNAGMVVDIAVLRNDGDADGDVLSVVRVTQGGNGSVLVNGDDSVRYQPNEGFTGLDGFAYTVSDDQGHTATATVSVRVNVVTDEALYEVPQYFTLEEDDR
jgi:hypothetical protein